MKNKLISAHYLHSYSHTPVVGWFKGGHGHLWGHHPLNANSVPLTGQMA